MLQLLCVSNAEASIEYKQTRGFNYENSDKFQRQESRLND